MEPYLFTNCDTCHEKGSRLQWRGLMWGGVFVLLATFPGKLLPLSTAIGNACYGSLPSSKHTILKVLQIWQDGQFFLLHSVLCRMVMGLENPLICWCWFICTRTCFSWCYVEVSSSLGIGHWFLTRWISLWISWASSSMVAELHEWEIRELCFLLPSVRSCIS